MEKLIEALEDLVRAVRDSNYDSDVLRDLSDAQERAEELLKEIELEALQKANKDNKEEKLIKALEKIREISDSISIYSVHGTEASDIRLIAHKALQKSKKEHLTIISEKELKERKNPAYNGQEVPKEQKLKKWKENPLTKNPFKDDKVLDVEGYLRSHEIWEKFNNETSGFYNIAPKFIINLLTDFASQSNLSKEIEIESVEGATEYLKKEGVDVDYYAKKGLEEMK